MYVFTEVECAAVSIILIIVVVYHSLEENAS